MSDRMLLLNTALAGLRAVKVGILLAIITFFISFIAIEFWPQAARLTLASWKLGYWAVVVCALVLLVIHHAQMPDWRRALIGVIGLHLPVLTGSALFHLWAFGRRSGGLREFALLAGFIASSMMIGMLVWWVTRLVLGRTWVVSQMQCVYCDYSLTGLTSIVCPECGNEILEAIDALGTGQSVPVARSTHEVV